MKPARLLAVLSALSMTSLAQVSQATFPLIINEYNVVSGQKYLDTDLYPDSLKFDRFFGRFQGNGGNWIEMVVTQDHLDIRNWKLVWSYNKDQAFVDYGNGTIQFSNDPLLSDLRVGTILTITEHNTAQGGLDTDTSFDPATDDWNMNFHSLDATYITTSGSITEGGVTRPAVPGEFACNNDDWQVEIRNASDTVVFGPIGEHLQPTNWRPGANLNSREVAKLEVNPSDSISYQDYNDGESSSFGGPNVWTDALLGEVTQDFSALRTIASSPKNLTVTEAKSTTTSGKIRLTNVVVTKIFPDRFYVRSQSQVAGIQVAVPPTFTGTWPIVGDIVTVVGQPVKNRDGERTLQLSAIESVTPGGTVKVVNFTTKNVGGNVPSGFQGPVMGSVGPNNIGLTAKVWGKVTGKGQDPDDLSWWFVVNDGINRISGETGISGVKVVGNFNQGDLTVGHSWVTVEGAVSLFKRSESEIYPVIRVAQPTDVQVKTTLP